MRERTSLGRGDHREWPGTLTGGWPTGRLLVLASVLLGTAAAAGCGPRYPNCDDDDDCRAREYCVDGRCQQCRNDGDCPEGRRCTRGRCEPIEGWCRTSGDCPPGMECRGNRCQVVSRAQTEVPAATPTPTPQVCQLAPVYFGFDQDTLEANARATLQANVECMRQRGIRAVHVTGYTDPRGTEEYNLALGERRAQSVRNYLRSLGVDASAITTSSMGEEMATGTDEASWAVDRRAEMSER